MSWNLTPLLLNPANEPVSAARFTRSAAAENTAKLFNRADLYDRKAYDWAKSTGDFLGRLWALYGEPDTIGREGFTYHLRDEVTGKAFSAYSASSGPAFGGWGAETMKPVLVLFEALLAQTKPADCEIEYDTDYGVHKSGSRHGKPFDKSLNGAGRPQEAPEPDSYVPGSATAAGEREDIEKVEGLIAAADFPAAYKSALEMRAREKRLSAATRVRLRAAFDKIDMWRSLRK